MNNRLKMILRFLFVTVMLCIISMNYNKVYAYEITYDASPVEGYHKEKITSSAEDCTHSVKYSSEKTAVVYSTINKLNPSDTELNFAIILQ